MTFIESVKTVYGKYATFSGRATRSEYWWFTLFFYLALGVIMLLGIAIQSDSIVFGGIAIIISFSILPIIALRVRRLHDIGKSGWWLLIGLIPYIGSFVLFIFSLLRSDGENEYGPDPFEEETI